MQFTTILIAMIPLMGSAMAKLHSAAVCTTGTQVSSIGGTPFSPSQNFQKNYEILTEATKCACNLYKNRNTGSKMWDRCPDCTFDGTTCHSAGKHIGGDEITYYCQKKCGAPSVETD